MDRTYPSSIVALNPLSGVLVATQAVDDDPYILSESADDKFLYAAFAGASNESQLALPSLSPVNTWPLFAPLPTVEIYHFSVTPKPRRED